MQKSVEDEESWGGSSVALEEMGVAVLAGAYNIESEEVQRRIPSADILAIATRVQELLRTGVPVGDTVGAAAVSGARPVLSLVVMALGICARLRRRYAAWLRGLHLPP